MRPPYSTCTTENTDKLRCDQRESIWSLEVRIFFHIEAEDLRKASLGKVKSCLLRRRHLLHAAPENRTRTNRLKLQGGRFQSNMKKKTKNRNRNKKLKNPNKLLISIWMKFPCFNIKLVNTFCIWQSQNKKGKVYILTVQNLSETDISFPMDNLTFFKFLFIYLVGLGIELKASCKLGEDSNTELYFQPQSDILQKFYYYHHHYYHYCMCMMCVGEYMYHATCGSHITISWSQFFPSTFSWVPGIELSSSALLPSGQPPIWKSCY